MTAPTAIALVSFRAATARERIRAYLELTKPRISALILLTAVAGFWLGSKGTPDAVLLLAATAGVGLLAGGIFALNQYLEQDVDGLMSRTAARPLPQGRLRAGEALAFGLTLSVVSVMWLAARVNAAAGVVALATLASYLFLYTPLKRKTLHCTFVGAFPGAAPPLLGWVAAGGALGLQAWALFAILFLWQFPHFHAIGSLYRDDYARAGLRVGPVTPQMLAAAALLVPVSLLPAVFGLAGTPYFCGAVGLGTMFLYRSIRAAQRKSNAEAQRLLLASVVYLPALFLWMVLNKR